MTTYREYLDNQLKNPDFKAEWDRLHEEVEIIKALTEARIEAGLTQKELSKRSGIAQGDISKIENGIANPTIETLFRLASAMGKKIRIEVI